MFSRPSRSSVALFAFALSMFASLTVTAAEAQIEQVYQRPPEVVAEVVDAPFTPVISATSPILK